MSLVVSTTLGPVALFTEVTDVGTANLTQFDKVLAGVALKT